VRRSLVLGFAIACGNHAAPPSAPAQPLPADPVVDIGTMDAECDGLIAALTAYKACPNLEDDDRDALDAWIERAEWDLAAGKKVEIEANAQRQAAAACRKAARSVTAAHDRCKNGKRPKEGTIAP